MTTPDPPEPLRSFDDAAASLAPEIERLGQCHARYLAERDAGRIPANSVEALRVELTYHSNAIEGSTLTLRETQLILEGIAPEGGRSLREIYEARNHDRALALVEQWAVGRPPGSSNTEHDLLAVHACVLSDIDPLNAGRFGGERVLIKGTRYIPPPSRDFDRLMPVLLERSVRPNVHPGVRAAELHYNLAAVHPFFDGNGRTARLFMNFHLLRHNFLHAIIRVEQRARYLAALEDANAGGTRLFPAFIIRSLHDSMQHLLSPD